MPRGKAFVWQGGNCPPFCIVTWKDPSSPTGSEAVWMPPDKVAALTPLDCVASGMLLAEDDEKIVIGSSACPTNGQSGGHITIPKKAIVFRGNFSVGLSARGKKNEAQATKRG